MRFPLKNSVGRIADTLKSLFLTSALLVVIDVHAQVPVDNASEQRVAQVPMRGVGVFGSTLQLHTEVFKPIGVGPYPVLVYSHGRSGTQKERDAMSEVIPRAYLQFWLLRGFAVVAPARPGYGATGGSDREMPGHGWNSAGACLGTPNPEKVAMIASTAVEATINWLVDQPWANTKKLILSGNSVGGLATVLLGSKSLPGVLGYINFAGGIAGNPDISPGKSCAPDRVQAAYAKWGQSTRTPNLWLYAENDLFWGSDAPKQWHASFATGGSQTKLVTTGPVPGKDGHDLIFVGQALWSEHVDAFIKTNGFN